MNRFVRWGATLFVLFGVTGCPLLRRRERAPDGHVALHAPSGIAFPAVVAGFARDAELHQFDREGRDVSAAYSLQLNGRPGIEATVYVYPAPEGPAQTLLEDERRRVEREIAASHAGAQPFERGAVAHVQGGLQSSGLRLQYRFPLQMWGADDGHHRSEAFLFVHRGWFIKYRFTVLVGGDPPWASPAIEGFLAELQWPTGP